MGFEIIDIKAVIKITRLKSQIVSNENNTLKLIIVMRKEIIYLPLVLIIFFVSNKVVKSQRNYDSLLSSLVQVIKNQENITDELLFQCIPVSANEYLRFSNLDYSKYQDDNYLFRKINEL